MDRIAIEKDLNEYKKVILVIDGILKDENYTEKICSFLNMNNLSGDVKVYSKEKIKILYPSFTGVSENEQKEILDLYHTYQFSDRFEVFGKSENFGNILNYLEADIMNIREIMEAYFSKLM